MSQDAHRPFAKQFFNRTWELLDLPSRNAEQEEEMLAAAFASRLHWGHAGGPREWIMGDWQIAHVASHLSMGALAQRYAGRALQRAQAEGITHWLLASCYEGVARAAGAAGDATARDQAAARAREILATVEDPDDRGLIEQQLASIPGIS